MRSFLLTHSLELGREVDNAECSQPRARGEDGGKEENGKCFYLWLSRAGTQERDEGELLLRVTHWQHPQPSVQGARAGIELILGFSSWENLGSIISLLSSLGRAGGGGRRAKQEQVGAADGMFAQEPLASHFLSLPELMGQLFGATRVCHGKFHPGHASSPGGSSLEIPNVIF